MKKRPVLGLIETVTVISPDKEVILNSRIDTGATSSSIDINLAKKLNLGPVTKTKIVKSASGVKRRPLVKLKIKLNGSIIEADFTLADRSHMNYPLLIGQNVLKLGRFMIDTLK